MRTGRPKRIALSILLILFLGLSALSRPAGDDDGRPTNSSSQSAEPMFFGEVKDSCDDALSVSLASLLETAAFGSFVTATGFTWGFPLLGTPAKAEQKLFKLHLALLI